MALAAVPSKAVILLLMHCLLVLQLCVEAGFVLSPCLVMQASLSFYNDLAEEESESWLLLIIVFLLSCGCLCFVSLLRGATVGLWSVTVTFPYHIHVCFAIGLFIALVYNILVNFLTSSILSITSIQGVQTVKRKYYNFSNIHTIPRSVKLTHKLYNAYEYSFKVTHELSGHVFIEFLSLIL